MSYNNIVLFIYLIPVILLSLSFHEFSHAFVSYRLGDPTAKNLGRVTLNPIKHLDPFGTIMLVVSLFQGMGFGWAKPVPINPNYYNDSKRGTMIVSLAGPLSNVLLALIFSIPMAVIALRNEIGMDLIFDIHRRLFSTVFDSQSILFNFSRLFFVTNVGLAVFNILPVPPLDGSKILSGILPTEIYFKFMQYENYIGIIFLVVILMFSRVLDIIMTPFIWIVITVIKAIVIPIVNMLV